MIRHRSRYGGIDGVCSTLFEAGQKFFKLAGEGSLQFKGLAVMGCVNASRAAWRKLRLSLRRCGLGIATRGAGGSGLRGDLISELRRSAVERVADDRVADGGHVDANLVGAAGFDADADQRELAETGVEAAHHFVVRDGGTGVVGGRVVMRVRRTGSRLTAAVMVPFWRSTAPCTSAM